MKKIVFVILFSLIGCGHFRQKECSSKKLNYPQKCIIYIDVDSGATETYVFEMVKDVCGVREENKCYVINILSDNEFMGWSFICF